MSNILVHWLIVLKFIGPCVPIRDSENMITAALDILILVLSLLMHLHEYVMQVAAILFAWLP